MRSVLRKLGLKLDVEARLWEISWCCGWGDGEIDVELGDEDEGALAVAAAMGMVRRGHFQGVLSL